MISESQREAISYLWSVGDLSYKLWDQQLDIYKVIRSFPRHVQTVVALLARQYGKSVMGCVMATEDCLNNSEVVVMIIGPTIKQTRAIVRPRMRLVTKDSPEGFIRFVKSEDTYYFKNGSELKLGGFDSNSSDHRGKTLHKVYIEEILESDPDTYLDFLRSDLVPALTHSKHAQIVFLTTLPKIPDHPFCTETIPDAEKEGAFFIRTIYDNTKIDKDQFDSIVKLCGGIDSIDFKREYLCQQVRDSTIVLCPEFDEKIHVTEFKIPEYINYWIGGDMGGVRDKHAFYLMGYDFERDKILVIDERFFEPETISDIIIHQLRDMESNLKIVGRYVDSDGQIQVDFLHQHKYPIVLPRKDELEATVNQVRVSVARSKIEISKKCKNLIMTLRSGTFNENKTDLARTKALGHMDAFMALAYGIRHAIKSNPFPLYKNDVSYNTHYIAHDTIRNDRTAQTLRSLFR